MAKVYSRGPNPPATDLENLRDLSGIFGASDDLRQKVVDQLEELVAALGVARAFSNNPDAKKLLVKIQHKIFNVIFILQNKISPSDPNAQLTINQLDVQGLTNCINVFGMGLPLSLKKVIPGSNKAGSMMRLAQTAARRTATTMASLAQSDPSFALITNLLQLLSALLQILERTEYKIANLEEEYWN